MEKAARPHRSDSRQTVIWKTYLWLRWTDLPATLSPERANIFIMVAGVLVVVCCVLWKMGPCYQESRYQKLRFRTIESQQPHTNKAATSLCLLNLIVPSHEPRVTIQSNHKTIQDGTSRRKSPSNAQQMGQNA